MLAIAQDQASLHLETNNESKVSLGKLIYHHSIHNGFDDKNIIPNIHRKIQKETSTKKRMYPKEDAAPVHVRG